MTMAVKEAADRLRQAIDEARQAVPKVFQLSDRQAMEGALAEARDACDELLGTIRIAGAGKSTVSVEHLPRFQSSNQKDPELQVGTPEAPPKRRGG